MAEVDLFGQLYVHKNKNLYSFFVCIGKSDPNDDMSYMTKGVQYEWVDSDTIQERTMESCEKMILRSSKKNETATN